MTNDERAVWIAGKLELAKMRQYEDWVEYVWDAVNLGLGNIDDLTEWLSSPEGISAVKARMIERGYSMYLDYNAENKEWCCDFFFPKKHQGKNGNTEAEAVLIACEKALKAEISEIL